MPGRRGGLPFVDRAGHVLPGLPGTLAVYEFRPGVRQTRLGGSRPRQSTGADAAGHASLRAGPHPRRTLLARLADALADLRALREGADGCVFGPRILDRRAFVRERTRRVLG